VPDYAEITVDFRTLPSQAHPHIVKSLESILSEVAKDLSGFDAQVEVINDKPAMSTPEEDIFVRAAQETGHRLWNKELSPKGVTYYTDASVLAPACHKPVIILGPGQAEQAHQTDEYVELWHLHQAAEFYRQLALNWLG
jgi:succinyl-diaminopimelate desuccinylase